MAAVLLHIASVERSGFGDPNKPLAEGRAVSVSVRLQWRRR